MTGKDLEVFVSALSAWSAGRKDHFRRILAVNPDWPQEAVLRGFFPHAEVTSLSYPAVDLSTGVAGGPYDMVFVANTMMCSPDPGRWISNCLGAADEVWIQDLVRAWRNGSCELSPETGDIARFTFPALGEESRVPGYDIERDGRFSVGLGIFYSDDPAGEMDCRKFIVQVRRSRNAGATGGGAELSAPPPSPQRGDDTTGGGTKVRRPLPL